MMGIVADIKDIAARSTLAWEEAVDTAGPEYAGGSAERAASMQALADECDESYEAAIDTLRNQYAGWQAEARGHLLDAKQRESDGGDASCAIEALEALAEYLAESGAPDVTDEQIVTRA